MPPSYTPSTPKPGGARAPASAPRLGPNFGGRPSVNGMVGLAQAYKNLTSQPNYAQTHGMQGQYIGAPGARPVDMAQAYGNMGGQLSGYSYSHPPAGTWTPTGAAPPTSAPTGGSSGTPQTDWFTAAQSDPEFMSKAAMLDAKVNGEVAGLQQSLGFDTTNLQEALANLGYARNEDGSVTAAGHGQLQNAMLGVEQKANARGALYSSVLGQQEGNTASQFGQKAGTLTDNYQRTVGTTQEKMRSALNEAGIDKNNLLWATIQRLEKNLPISPSNPPDQGAGGGAGSPGAGQPAPGTGSGFVPKGVPVHNNGGYAGVRGPGGAPIPVDMAQAYGNLGGALPGMRYFPAKSGAGQWSYVGTHGPVDLAQAYKNLLAKKGKK